MRTQPTTGSRIRRPAVRKVPTSFAAQKLASALLLEPGIAAALCKEAVERRPEVDDGLLRRHLVTSYIHGNRAR